MVKVFIYSINVHSELNSVQRTEFTPPGHRVARWFEQLKLALVPGWIGSESQTLSVHLTVNIPVNDSFIIRTRYLNKIRLLHTRL